MKQPAQWQIVLRELRNAGSRGVHTFELRRMYIGNPSQRISELEDRGYTVRSTREKLDGTATGSRYVLVTEPVDTPRPSPAPTLGVDAFAHRPRLAIFDDDWEAA